MSTPRTQESAAKGQSRRVITTVAAFNESLVDLTGDTDMGVQQMTVLLALYVHGEVEQARLGDYTRVERSANSRNIRKLGPGEKPWVKAGPGYVESFDDPRNLRIKIVRLTPKGKALLEEAAHRAAGIL